MNIELTARDLLNELLALEKERADFDTLHVYLGIVDQRSYDAEHAEPHLEEYTEVCTAEGAAYSLVVVTGYDMDVSPPQEVGDYILIRAVDDIEVPA